MVGLSLTEPAALEVPGAQSREPIRVAVLDDHVVVRYGIELLITNSPGYAWTGAASTTAELLRLLVSTPCNVLVLDYQLAPDEIDGWSLVRHLRSHFPHVRILVYTSYCGANTAAIMRRAGAHGLLSKNAGLDPLLDALQLVGSGAMAFPPGNEDPAESSDLSGDQVTLSPRENEVLRCCLQGMSVTRIAQKYNRSVKTVSAQKQAAFRKLGVRTDHDFLLMYAYTRPDAGWTRT